VQERRLPESQPLEQLDEVIEKIRRLMLRSASKNFQQGEAEEEGSLP
jgi:hypothetical protein